KWSTWFHGAPQHRPYWMNSASSIPILFTVSIVATAGMIAAWARTRSRKRIHPRLTDAVTSGALVAVGASVSMIVILFIGPGRPGSLFPIAIATGGLVLSLGAIVGSVAAVVSFDLWR